jgi:hypothetical protein
MFMKKYGALIDFNLLEYLGNFEIQVQTVIGTVIKTRVRQHHHHWRLKQIPS